MKHYYDKNTAWSRVMYSNFFGEVFLLFVRGLGNARCTAWAEDRVRVMAVCPGGVDTHMIKEFLKVRIMIAVMSSFVNFFMT